MKGGGRRRQQDQKMLTGRRCRCCCFCCVMLNKSQKEQDMDMDTTLASGWVRERGGDWRRTMKRLQPCGFSIEIARRRRRRRLDMDCSCLRLRSMWLKMNTRKTFDQSRRGSGGRGKGWQQGSQLRPPRYALHTVYAYSIQTASPHSTFQQRHS